MNCNDLQKRLLQRRTEDAEALRHVDACPDCRSFKAVLEAIEENPPPLQEPDARLDRIVLKAARDRRTAERPRPGWIVYRILAPALASAAALTLAGLVWLYALRSGSPPSAVVSGKKVAAVQNSIPRGEDIDTELIALEAELTGLSEDASASSKPSDRPQAQSPSSSIDSALMLLDAEIYILQDQLEQQDAPPNAPPQARNSAASPRRMS